MWTGEKIEIGDSFTPLAEFGHRIQQCVMTLVVIDDGAVVPVGTGFVIAVDGLLMTASHVITEAMKRVVHRTNPNGEMERQLALFALYLTSETQGDSRENVIGGLIPITHVAFPEELDIGYCSLRRPLRDGIPLRFPVFRLSPGLPKVGEQILGFGYYGMKGHITDSSSDGAIHIDYRQETAFTRGRIVEVHSPMRDRGMLHFPCFRTDARFEHGMSGGPILNENGSVCGVICSSFPPFETDPEHISFGSLVWPALGISVEGALREGGPVEKVTIYELVQRGIVQCDETIAQVQVIMGDNGERSIHLRL
jgi:Trypsin-like peptidase domain